MYPINTFGASDILFWLRQHAGLPADGPGTEVKVWRENGPNDKPELEELKQVASWEHGGAKFQTLYIRHGDILVT